MSTMLSNSDEMPIGQLNANPDRSLYTPKTWGGSSSDNQSLTWPVSPMIDDERLKLRTAVSVSPNQCDLQPTCPCPPSPSEHANRSSPNLGSSNRDCLSNSLMLCTSTPRNLNVPGHLLLDSSGSWSNRSSPESPGYIGRPPGSPRSLVRPMLKNRRSAPKILTSVDEVLISPGSPIGRHSPGSPIGRQSPRSGRYFRDSPSITPPSGRSSSRSHSRTSSFENMLDIQELEKNLKRIPNSKEGLQPYVNLPKRYQTKLCQHSVAKKAHSISMETQDVDDRDTETREQDLDTAIKWLRQEIILMKKQDHMLMKQFLDLRSTIMTIKDERLQHYFHGSVNLSFSSCSDITSLDGSCQSLDDSRLEGAMSPNGGFMDSNIFEFRGRTMSMLTPRNAGRMHLKPKSKETWM